MFFINLNIYSPPSPANFFHLKRESLFSFKVHDNYDGSGSRGSYPFDWGLPVMRPKLRSTTNIINS